MNKQYTVVEFDDGVQLIPNVWIQGNEAFWPNFKTMTKYYSSVKNKLPPNPDWEKCKILRVLYTTDDYEYGLKKAKEAEEKTEVGTTDEEEERKQRRVRASRVISSSDDELDQTLLAEEIKYPKFPKNTCTGLSRATTEKKFIKHGSTKKNSHEIIEEAIESTKCLTDKTSMHKRVAGTPGSNKFVLQDQQDSAESLNFQQQSLDLLKNIQRKVVALSLLQQELLDRINNIEQRINIKQIDVVENEDPLNELFDAKFPINNCEDMDNVDTLIKTNDNFRKCVIRRSRLMLGKNLKTSIVNILVSLITNTVAAQYSWVGAKKKRAFFELEIVKVIQVAVRSKKDQEMATDSEISEAIKNWLRLGTLRRDREKKDNSTD